MRRPALATSVARACACLAALCPRVSLADGPPHARAQIAYTTAPDASPCPDDAGFRTELSRQLGYDPSSPEPTPIALEVTVQRTRRGTFEGTVRLSDHAKTVGVRSFDGASCGELVSSMALTIGILLEPFAPQDVEAPAPPDASPTPEAKSAPSAPSAPSPPPAPIESPVLERPHERRARPSFAVAVGEMQSLGLAPAPSLGLEALAGVATGRWSVDVEGRADLEASRSAPVGQRVGTSFVAGGVSPCLRVSVARACVVGLIGAIQGSVSGPGSTQRQSSLFGALGPRAGVEIRVAGPLTLRGHLDVLFPVSRVVLEQGGAELWTTSAVVGSLGFDAALSFP